MSQVKIDHTPITVHYDVASSLTRLAIKKGTTNYGRYDP